MMKPKEKQELFHKELKELLSKYKAEIMIDFITKGYSTDHRIIVGFQYDESMFEEHGTGVIPELDLGSYTDGT